MEDKVKFNELKVGQKLMLEDIVEIEDLNVDIVGEARFLVYDSGLAVLFADLGNSWGEVIQIKEYNSEEEFLMVSTFES